jgi:hypothetical protein
VIHLDDTSVRAIRIVVEDAYRNISTMQFGVQFNDSLAGLVERESSTEEFAPGIEQHFRAPEFEALIPATSFYDTVPRIYSRQESGEVHGLTALHQLNDDSYPLHGTMLVRIRPSKEVPPEWKDRIIIKRTGKSTSTRKAEWNDGWLTASFPDFGSFQAFADFLPPSVNDGEWLRFTNDKGRNWIYRFDERCPYGVHELKVTMEDLAGNITTKSWWFRREPYTPKKKVTKKKKR